MDIPQEILDQMNDLLETSYEKLGEYTETWDGDDPTSRTARAIVASARPVFDVFENIMNDAQEENAYEDANEAMFMLFFRHAYQVIQTLQVLEGLSELKKHE